MHARNALPEVEEIHKLASKRICRRDAESSDFLEIFKDLQIYRSMISPFWEILKDANMKIRSARGVPSDFEPLFDLLSSTIVR